MAETTPAEIAAATSTGPVTDTVTLAEPIQRGETTISTITLRKPRGGELRDMNLQDLLTTNVGALLKVIPRISNPPLTQAEADNLGPEDLAEIGGVVRGFFMTAAEKQAIQMLLAEHQPQT